MTVLVLGASGFLGSHVTRQLVDAGERVRVFLRKTSSTQGIDDLNVQRRYGDLFDDEALRAAMAGCDVVYYCVVDARMWLRDPAPLFHTNVEGLRNVLDIACEFIDSGLRKFVFTSTVGTMGTSTTRLVTEDDPAEWTGGGPYIESRRQAEALALSYAGERGLPVVAVCVGTTYGPRDFQPTPHGSMVARAAKGKLPFTPGFSLEVVGIEDAARAMLLAAERGRPGERYIVSERYMSLREVGEIVGAAAGVRPPRFTIPRPVMYGVSFLNDLASRLTRRDLPLAMAGTRMTELMTPLDHSKAERELGWKPEPIETALAKAVQFFLSQE